MTATAWATLLITFTVAIMIPGPDLFMLLRVGVRERRAAILAALGIMVGNTIWTLASVLGLSALLQALPGALPTLQLLGALVLIYMGVMSARSGTRALRELRAARITAPTTKLAEDDAAQAIDSGSAVIGTTVTKHPLRLGLITNLSNPKALLFFTALFSQILPPQASWFERAEILLVLTAVGLAWFVGFALLTSSKVFQRWFGRVTPYIDIVAGGVFMLVAGVILFELAIALI